MAKQVVIEFEVIGVFDFPIDMLRYDSCFPATEIDSGKIHVKSFPQKHRKNKKKINTMPTMGSVRSGISCHRLR